MNHDEPRNFFMIVHLVMDIGAWISRKIFLKEAPVNSLSSRFQNVLTNPVHRKNFNRKQLELIKEVPPEPEKFDISLTVGLIRLTCPGIPPPANGWENPPDLTDTSTAADLKRLLDIRNNKLHSSSASLGYSDVKILWNTATETIKRLARGISPELEKNVQDKIEEIKSKWSGMSAGDVLRLQEIFESQREAYDSNMEHLNQMIDQIHKLLTDHCTGHACPSIQVIENNTAADIPNTTRLSTSEPHEEIQPQEPVTEEMDFIDHVTLIKVYHWIKTELYKHLAIELFKDLKQTDDSFNKMERRSVVDKLLKFVLKRREIGYIRKFVNEMTARFDRKEDLQIEWDRHSNPTENEIEEYKQMNSPRLRPRDPVTDPFNLEECIEKQIIFVLKEFEIIDTINDRFLSNFYYGLMEHDEVCDRLHRHELDLALRQLFAIMKSCPMTIKGCFCETLRGTEYEHIITDFELDYEENRPEETGFQRFVRVVRAWGGPICQFSLQYARFGSMWFFLKSDSPNAWDQLKEKCEAGDVTEMLDKVISDSVMLHVVASDGCKLLMTIYKEDEEAANSKEETLILKFDIKNDKLHQQTDTADANISPISSHNRLLCEEMDITDDLIEQLRMENIVAEDIREQMKKIRSRAGRINYLLTDISEPEKGYEIIKDQQKSNNPFLYKELCKKDQRKLLFKCEAKLQSKAQTADSVGESNRNFTWKITSSSCFFDSKDKPNAPSTPECKGTTKDSITLSWEPPRNYSGSLITGYRLEKRGKGDNTWSKCSSADIPDNEFTVKGLQEGNEYDFRVAAVNKAGVGDFAETENAIKAQTPILASQVFPLDIIAEKVQPFEVHFKPDDMNSPLKTYKYQKDWTSELTTMKSTLEQETVPTKADFKSLTEPKLKPGLQIPKVLRGIKSYDTNEIIETLGTWDEDKSLCQNYMRRIESILQQADKEKNWTQMEPLVNKLDTLKKKWEKQSDSLPSCCQELESFRTSAGLMISLGHLAFNLLFGKSTSDEQKLVFPKQECKKYLSDEELNVCLSIGILSKSPTFRGIREIDSYSFSRKSVQEFLSALWLAGPGADSVGRITEGISEETGRYSLYDAVDNVELLLKFLSGLGPQVAAKPLQYIYTQDIKYYVTSRINKLILSCCAESQHCNNTKHIYFTFPEIRFWWETMSDDDIRMLANIVEASSSCLRRLDIVGLTLQHESVEEPSDISSCHCSIDTLYQSLSCCGNLEDLCLYNIYCRDDRHDNISSVLDLHNLHKLEKLELWGLSVRTVLWPPVTNSCLRRLDIRDLKLPHECVEELCRTYVQYRQSRRVRCEVSWIFCVDHRTLCHSFEDLQKHIKPVESAKCALV